MMKKLLFSTLSILFAFSLAAQSLNWHIEDETFSAGDTVRAEFAVYGFNDIVAYQFAMKFDTGTFSFVGVEFPPDNPLGLDANDFGFWQTNKGILRHLWSNPYGQDISDGTHLFIYTLRAKKSGTLSQKFTLATCCLSPPLYPVSYRYVLTGQPLTVSYVSAQEFAATSDDLEKSIAVYPNPASGFIWIECPTLSEIKIFDFSGRLTHQDTMQAGAFWGLHNGVNLVWIDTGNGIVLKTVVSE